VPTALGEMLQDKDPEKPKRVMADIAALRNAYEGRAG
jgi:hypothetical protein